MRTLARLAHVFGLILLLGSILTFLVASSVGEGGGLVELAVARRIVGAGTMRLTLPGLALVVASGAALVALRAGAWRAWSVRIMALAVAGVLANGLLLVLPAVRGATALAEASLAAGRLAPGYAPAYARETAAGDVNIGLVIVALVAGVAGLGAPGAVKEERS